MGSYEIDWQLRRCASQLRNKLKCAAAQDGKFHHTHVFGHSHLPSDATHESVRYMQQALGYPQDWWNSRGRPRCLWGDAVPFAPEGVPSPS